MHTALAGNSNASIELVKETLIGKRIADVNGEWSDIVLDISNKVLDLENVLVNNGIIDDNDVISELKASLNELQDVIVGGNDDIMSFLALCRDMTTFNDNATVMPFLRIVLDKDFYARKAFKQDS